MNIKEHNRKRAEKEHRLISQLLLSNDIKEIKYQYGNKDLAETRLLALEKYLNYGKGG